MKFIKLSIIAIGFLSVTTTSLANEIVLTTNKSIKIAYRIAHKNLNDRTIFEEMQSIELNKVATIPVSLDDYDRAGIVIISANGHALPPTANQFDQPEQCSMTTDKNKSYGMLKFTLSEHTSTCTTIGGVFS